MFNIFYFAAEPDTHYDLLKCIFVITLDFVEDFKV